MDNLVFGLLTIAICTFGYGYAWKCHAEDKLSAALWLLVFSGLVLRVYTSTDLFLHVWDERYHALVAKNLLLHPLTPTLYESPILPYAFQNWTANHIWLHKQPLPLWCMALSMQCFGVNELALRLPSVLLSTAGIYLTYSIACHFFDRKVSFLAAFLFSINGLIVELTGGRVATDHIDIFFMFFVLLGIHFSVRFAQRPKLLTSVLVGLSIGAAILCKWLPALIVLPIWILLVWDARQLKSKAIMMHLGIIAIVCLGTVMPWQLYIFHTFPNEASWEASFNIKHFTEALEGNGGPFYYFLNVIRINYGDLIYLPLIWYGWKTNTEPQNHKGWAIWIWFGIPLLFFSCAETKMQGYILFACPALFMITGKFWYFLVDYCKGHKFYYFFRIVLFLLIALPVRYTIERAKPFDVTTRNPVWIQKLRQFRPGWTENVVLFNYDKPIEAMFYADLTAYEVLPEKVVVANLIASGYHVFVEDHGAVPADIRSMVGVKMVKLTD